MLVKSSMGLQPSKVNLAHYSRCSILNAFLATNSS